MSTLKLSTLKLKRARKRKLERANILHKENIIEFHSVLVLYRRFLRQDWTKPGATRSALRAVPAVSRRWDYSSPEVPSSPCRSLPWCHGPGDREPGGKGREKAQPRSPAAPAKTKVKGKTVPRCKILWEQNWKVSTWSWISERERAVWWLFFFLKEKLFLYNY